MLKGGRAGSVNSPLSGRPKSFGKLSQDGHSPPIYGERGHRVAAEGALFASTKVVPRIEEDPSFDLFRKAVFYCPKTGDTQTAEQKIQRFGGRK